MDYFLATNLWNSHPTRPARSFHSTYTFNTILTYFAFLQHFERFMQIKGRIGRMPLHEAWHDTSWAVDTVFHSTLTKCFVRVQRSTAWGGDEALYEMVTKHFVRKRRCDAWNNKLSIYLSSQHRTTAHYKHFSIHHTDWFTNPFAPRHSYVSNPRGVCLKHSTCMFQT